MVASPGCDLVLMMRSAMGQKSRAILYFFFFKAGHFEIKKKKKRYSCQNLSLFKELNKM